jgi:prepilin-type N-terminal cleavage/methylation domain-containing protein
VNGRQLHPLRKARGKSKPTARGFTLLEVILAMGLGTVVLAGVASLSLYGAFSSVAVVNYTDLDSRSRNALDVVGREIRQATALVSFQTNLPVKSLTFTNTFTAQGIRLSWDSTAGTILFQLTGQPDRTILTECDRWDFALCQRTPWISATNIVFYPATNNAGVLTPSLCKLVNMSWKCSRTILGRKVNTETVQTAQLVLRNKQ